MDASEYERVKAYLSRSVYPSEFNKDEKRQLRRKALQFHLDESQILYLKSKVGVGNRRVIRQEEKVNILSHIHSGIGGAHYGESNTIR